MISVGADIVPRCKFFLIGNPGMGARGLRTCLGLHRGVHGMTIVCPGHAETSTYRVATPRRVRTPISASVRILHNFYVTCKAQATMYRSNASQSRIGKAARDRTTASRRKPGGAHRAEDLAENPTMERVGRSPPALLGRMGGTSLRPRRAASRARLTGASQAPGRLTALHPPLDGVGKKQTSGAKCAPRTGLAV
jgi:hypothetical protein